MADNCVTLTVQAPEETGGEEPPDDGGGEEPPSGGDGANPMYIGAGVVGLGALAYAASKKKER